MTKHILFGNYGNPTIALLQWAHEAALPDVTVVSINTGWAASGWATRVTQAQTYAIQCGFTVEHLSAPQTFTDLVRDRQTFPSAKFHWCAGLLKGLPFLEWLDRIDPGATSKILLPKSRAFSRAAADLPEFVEQSEHYGDRALWHPLWAHSVAECDALVLRAGFAILRQRSLECDPCIHSNAHDLQQLSATDVAKTHDVEREIGQSLFAHGDIEHTIRWAQTTTATANDTSAFDRGCGSPYVCGL